MHFQVGGQSWPFVSSSPQSCQTVIRFADSTASVSSESSVCERAGCQDRGLTGKLDPTQRCFQLNSLSFWTPASSERSCIVSTHLGPCCSDQQLKPKTLRTAELISCWCDCAGRVPGSAGHGFKVRGVRELLHGQAGMSQLTRQSWVTEERRFISQAQLLPTGLRFHGRDIVTWLHLGVRGAEKWHLKCAQRRDILGAFGSEGQED